MSTEPTDEGKQRYPTTGGFFTSDMFRDDVREPCTCTQFCQRICAGQCGCKACGLRFTMWCDVMGYYNSSEGFTEELEHKAQLEYTRQEWPPGEWVFPDK